MISFGFIDKHMLTNKTVYKTSIGFFSWSLDLFETSMYKTSIKEFSWSLDLFETSMYKHVPVQLEKKM